MPSIEDLRQKQSLPLQAKVLMSKRRIQQWYDHWDGNVYISFSGGKDSTVLAHLVHEYYPDVPLVFSNTGLEYPEIQSFARKMGATFIRPNLQFSEVISMYGYPIISKEVSEAIYYARMIKNNRQMKETDRRRSDICSTRQEYDKQLLHYIRSRAELDGVRFIGENGKTVIKSKDEKDCSLEASPYNKTKWKTLCEETMFKVSHKCCTAMKKQPIARYEKENKSYAYIGTLAEESRLRTTSWLRYGCNSYEGKKHSRPMSFWLEQDVLQYIKEEGLEIASVYGDIATVDENGFEYGETLVPCGKLRCTGCQRTGCIFCGFGAHLDKGQTRFQRLAKTHPKQYEYCMRGGQWVDNPEYDPTAPETDGEWKNWNPKKVWVPSKEGLGMKKVFDDCNAIYGKDFIRYE